MIELLDKPIPSPSFLDKITQDFVAEVKQFATDNGIPWIKSEHGQPKDDVANGLRASRPVRDQVVFIGVAQENARDFSGRKCEQEKFVGFDYRWDKLGYASHYYFYIDDQDFGPVFIRICTYAPRGIKVCINGHQWAKRQVEKAGVKFETLDNGFLSCHEPETLREICDSLGPAQIDSCPRNPIAYLVTL